MGVLPQSRLDRLQWFEARVALWTANMASLGLTVPQTTELDTLVDAARAAFADKELRANAARAATQVFYSAGEALDEFGSDLIGSIKARADLEDKPDLYALANIPQPSPPTPLGVPDAPTSVLAVLQADGTIRVGWSASLRGGTGFAIHRQTEPVVGNPGAWTQIAAVRTKTFVDEAVPIGLGRVYYRVVALRGAGASTPSDPAVVYFGVGGEQAEAA